MASSFVRLFGVRSQSARGLLHSKISAPIERHCQSTESRFGLRQSSAAFEWRMGRPNGFDLWQALRRAQPKRQRTGALQKLRAYRAALSINRVSLWTVAVLCRFRMAHGPPEWLRALSGSSACAAKAPEDSCTPKSPRL